MPIDLTFKSLEFPSVTSVVDFLNLVLRAGNDKKNHSKTVEILL